MQKLVSIFNLRSGAIVMPVRYLVLAVWTALFLALPANSAPNAVANRPRARDTGIVIGELPPGSWNAITDVPGVLIGHMTMIRGDNIRTGVTAILPHAGNLFQEKVPGAVFTANGFGKLIGSTQVDELGEIETPILLTNTLNIPRVADALLDWMLQQPGNENVRSINPLVAETNDGQLNDIRGRYLGRDEVRTALQEAKSGPVAEGAVGAGTGTVAFGFKGGIGTSSRVLPKNGYMVGVLVQSNFGGKLVINGAPVGRELARAAPPANPSPSARTGDGSIIVVVATNAPLDARLLRRLAARAITGLARTGSAMSNGSGDYVIAFSTAEANRIHPGRGERTLQEVDNDSMTPLFQAVAEATEEAIIDSLFCAETMTGYNGFSAPGLPLDKTIEILRRFNALRPTQQPDALAP